MSKYARSHWMHIFHWMHILSVNVYPFNWTHIFSEHMLYQRMQININTTLSVYIWTIMLVLNLNKCLRGYIHLNTYIHFSGFRHLCSFEMFIFWIILFLNICLETVESNSPQDTSCQFLNYQSIFSFKT